MDISKCMSVVISYNPDPNDFINNVRKISKLDDIVIIIDNGSDNISLWELDIIRIENVKLLKNDSNLGLPINYNKAAKYAFKHKYEWMIIFDQDTTIPENFKEELVNYEPKDNVAIICPLFRDVNLYSEDEFKKIIPKDRFSSISECISSGSINRVSTIIELGGFDEKLFIDIIDFDYCKRVILNNYKIIQDNQIVIDHAIGKSRWVNFLGHRVIVYNHSALRKYYIVRNKMYYIRKYNYSIVSGRKRYISLIMSIIISFYEEHKIEKIKAAFKGLFDGLTMPVKKYKKC